jgi:hypothetical protein
LPQYEIVDIHDEAPLPQEDIGRISDPIVSDHSPTLGENDSDYMEYEVEDQYSPFSSDEEVDELVQVEEDGTSDEEERTDEEQEQGRGEGDTGEDGEEEEGEDGEVRGGEEDIEMTPDTQLR